MSQEVVLQGGNEQTLSKPPGAAEEVNLAFTHKVVNQLRFIHLEVALLTNLVKALHADRVLHHRSPLQFFAKIALFKGGGNIDAYAVGIMDEIRQALSGLVEKE